MSRNAIICATILVVGCYSPPSTVDSPNSKTHAAQLQEVTFYIDGMNERLKILWGDWPNKVKEALVGLPGVESVEDEWEREMGSEEDLNLLFVTFDAKEVTIDELKELIAEHEFQAEVKQEY